MSRFDKYDPYSGGFRAKLESAISSSDVGKVFGVSLNGSGRVVLGGALDVVRGVICATQEMAARDTIDVMTDGEITDFLLSGGSGATAGATVYSAVADGATSHTATGRSIGFCVESTRLIVRVPVVSTSAQLAALKLDDLADVDATTGVADGNVLKYVAAAAATAKWQAGTDAT